MTSTKLIQNPTERSFLERRRSLAGWVTSKTLQKFRIDYRELESGQVELTHEKFIIRGKRSFRGKILKSMISPFPDVIAGESYMDGEWWVHEGDLVDVLGVSSFVMDNKLLSIKMFSPIKRLVFWLSQFNNPNRSKNNVSRHYDIGNDLYRMFLDNEMNYSAGLYGKEGNTTESLESAQRRKNRTLSTLLELEQHDAVLEIGCGWGALSRLISDKCEHLTSISLSEEQIKLCEKSGADHENIEYIVEDYRAHCERMRTKYDKVVSVEMFDHVGKNHHKEFFKCVHNSLKPGGTFVMQVLTRPSTGITTRWINKYIFPGAYIASYSEIEKALCRGGFLLNGLQVSEYDGVHYSKTLKEWRARFNDRWKSLDSQKHDEKFYRMWNFYLAASEAVFTYSGFKTVHLKVVKEE